MDKNEGRTEFQYQAANRLLRERVEEQCKTSEAYMDVERSIQSKIGILQREIRLYEELSKGYALLPKPMQDLFGPAILNFINR